MDPQVPVVPVQEPKPVQQLNSLTVISMALFVLLSLGAVAFLYYQNQQLKNMLASYQPTPSTSPTPITSPTPFTFNVDPKTGWKIYSRIANFSFQFPNDWTEQSNYSLQSGDKLMSIWVEGDTVGLECLTQTKTLNKNIDGTLLALKYFDGMKSDNCDTQSKKVIFFLFSVDKQKYSFTFDYNDSNKIEAEKAFDQILSTFKFLETSATPSSSPTPSSLPQ